MIFVIFKLLNARSIFFFFCFVIAFMLIEILCVFKLLLHILMFYLQIAQIVKQLTYSICFPKDSQLLHIILDSVARTSFVGSW